LAIYSEIIIIFFCREGGEKRERNPFRAISKFEKGKKYIEAPSAFDQELHFGKEKEHDRLVSTIRSRVGERGGEGGKPGAHSRLEFDSPAPPKRSKEREEFSEGSGVLE